MASVEKIKKIGVIGLGYVGMSRINDIFQKTKGNDIFVVGIDRSKEVLTDLERLTRKSMNEKQEIYPDINLQAFRAGNKEDKFESGEILDGEEFSEREPINRNAELVWNCDVIIICINLGLDKYGEPLTDNLRTAAHFLRQCLRIRSNNSKSSCPLIILESTVFPGASERIIDYIQKPNQKDKDTYFNEDEYKIGTNFDFCCAPQRYDFCWNAKEAEIAEVPQDGTDNRPVQIIGHCSSDCKLHDSRCGSSRERGKDFYGDLLQYDVRSGYSLQEVEFAKIYENVYRSVNIALAHELHYLCDKNKMNIDLLEVIKASQTKPFGYTAFFPRAGIGGRCISDDPILLSWIGRSYLYTTKFINEAQRTNDSALRRSYTHFVDEMVKVGKLINGAKVLLIGLGYKPDTHQYVKSPALYMAKKLFQDGAEVAFYDPYLQTLPIKDLFDESHHRVAKRKLASGVTTYLAAKQFENGTSPTEGPHDCTGLRLDMKNGLDEFDAVVFINAPFAFDCWDTDEKNKYLKFVDKVKSIFDNNSRGKLLHDAYGYISACEDYQKWLDESVQTDKSPSSTHGKALFEKINNKEAVVWVVGLGYVGFPLLLRIAEMGFKAVGFEMNETIVQSLNNESPDMHIEGVKKKKFVEIKNNKNLSIFSTEKHDRNDFSQPDIIIFCIGTPVNEYRTPDLTHLNKAIEEFREHFRLEQPNNHKPLVILESTTYPGCTRELFLDSVELKSDCKDPSFFLAYSPERIDPGPESDPFSAISKVVGGINEDSGIVARAFYKTIIDSAIVKQNMIKKLKKAKYFPQDPSLPSNGRVRVPNKFSKLRMLASPRMFLPMDEVDAVTLVESLEVAEMSKLLENVYRSVNIALVDELLILADRMGLNFWNIIEIASTKLGIYDVFTPGPGFGGHCIPIDPFYLSWKAKKYQKQLQFIELAGQMNLTITKYTLDKIVSLINLEKVVEYQCGGCQNGIVEKRVALRDAKILFMGVAYKENVGDIRATTSIEIMKGLKGLGATIEWYDPHVLKTGKFFKSTDREKKPEHGAKSVDDYMFLRNHCQPVKKLGVGTNWGNYACIVIYTMHQDFLDDSLIEKIVLQSNTPVLDCRNYLEKENKNRKGENLINRGEQYHILGVTNWEIDTFKAKEP